MNRAGDTPVRVGGFTLIELMLAITLSALVVLLAHRVFAGVVDGTARLQAGREALDRDSNARRALHEAFGSLDVGTVEGSSFIGRPERVEFSAWLRVPQGWLERRRVSIGVEGARFTLAGADDAPVVLRENVARVEFDYLLEPGGREAWVRQWISPVSAPVAVRIRINAEQTDTLLVVVGTRG